MINSILLLLLIQIIKQYILVSMSVNGLDPLKLRQVTPNSDIPTLQSAVKERDQLISAMQSIISRLEMKNKQYSAYQALVAEYEDKALQAQSLLFKANQNIRDRETQLKDLKKQNQQMSKKLNSHQKSSSYVSKQDYNKIYDEMLKVKQQYHKTLHHQDTIENLSNKIKIISQEKQRVQKQNQATHGILSKKDVQIYHLKKQVLAFEEKNSGHNLGQPRSQTSITSVKNIEGSMRSVEDDLNKYQYEVQSFMKQNEQLKVKCQLLQHQLYQYKHSSSEWSIEEKNKQHLEMIRKYEEHIESMAAKLSSIHKLEMEKRNIDGERRKYKDQCDALRQQLMGLRSYCDSLENKIRKNDEYQALHLQSDMQRFLNKNEDLNTRAHKLYKLVQDKCEEIVELKNNFTKISLTQEKIQKMGEALNSLENTLKNVRQQLRKEQEKVFAEQDKYNKLQKEFKRAQINHNQVKSEMGKLNRTISQKVQKIQLQSMQISRLKKQNQQKLELSEKLSKLQKQYKELDKKFDIQIDESNQLAMSVIVLSAEIERMSENGIVSKGLLQQFEQMRIKAKQIQVHIKNLQERIKRLEQLHKKVVQESIKISQHLHASHKRWNYYDMAMQQMNSFLQSVMKSSNQKYDELDGNIEKWLTMQKQRLDQMREKQQQEFLITSTPKPNQS